MMAHGPHQGPKIQVGGIDLISPGKVLDLSLGLADYVDLGCQYQEM